MVKKCWLVSVFAVLFLSFSVVSAQDLIIFGDLAGEVYALDDSSGDVVWTYTYTFGTDGVGWLSLSEGIVYGSTVGYTGGQDVVALDADDGSLLWRYTIPGVADVTGTYIDDGVVFFGSTGGVVYALNADDGSELWTHTFGSPYEIEGTPYVKSDTVYVAAGDYLYALDASDGSELWSAYVIDGGFKASPIVSGKTVYIGSGRTDASLYAFDAEDGSLEWSHEVSSGLQDFVAIFYGNEVIYAVTEAGELYAVDGTDGSEIWSYDMDGQYAPYVLENVVYAGSSIGSAKDLYAFDAADGSLLWTFSADSGVERILATDDRVYFGTQGGKFYAIKSDGSGSLWDYAASSSIVTQPILYTSEDSKEVLIDELAACGDELVAAEEADAKTPYQCYSNAQCAAIAQCVKGVCKPKVTKSSTSWLKKAPELSGSLAWLFALLALIVIAGVAYLFGQRKHKARKKK